jgi:hypothetical protein
MADLLKDAKHWRDRAEEARRHAEVFTDPQAKESMLRIAEEYEKLAQRAAMKLRTEQCRVAPRATL